MMGRQEDGKRHRTALCSGGGGIFVQPIKFVDKCKGNRRQIAVYIRERKWE